MKFNRFYSTLFSPYKLTCYCDIPFKEKDNARALKYKWSGDKKQWYFEVDLNGEVGETEYEIKNNFAQFRIVEIWSTWFLDGEEHGQKDKERLEKFVHNLWTNCRHCNKALVPIADKRENGTSRHSDWPNRKYHKKCWKELEHQREMKYEQSRIRIQAKKEKTEMQLLEEELEGLGK